MSLNRCAHCTTLFAVGIPHCPQCGNADYYLEGLMPKISRHSGASDGTPAPQPAEPVVAQDEVAPPVGPYDGLLRTELLNLLRDRGLSTIGNKDELVARLVASDEVAVEVVESDLSEADESEPAES